METSCSCTETTNSDWVTDWQPPSQERLSAERTGPTPLHRRQAGRMRSPGRRGEEVKLLSRPPELWRNPDTEQIFMCAPRACGTASTLFTRTGSASVTSDLLSSPYLCVSTKTFTPSGGFTGLAAHSCHHEGQCKVQHHNKIYQFI